MDYRPGRADLMADLRPKMADLRSRRAALRCERADLRHERAVFWGLERTDLRSEG